MERRVRSSTAAGFLVLAAVTLAAVLCLGVSMRWFLAGRLALPAPFGALSHAHSHLGYYGVLFPLAWYAWARVGAPVPGWPRLAIYAAAVAASGWGFATQGYGPLAIVASTVVLFVWLVDAVRLAPRMLRLHDWLAPATPSILLAAVSIPIVGVVMMQDPAMAAEVVQAFLTVLLFGVMVPAALRISRAPAPPMPVYTALVVLAALGIGPLPGALTAWGMAGLGALVGLAGWRARAPDEVRWLWAGLSGSLLALGTGLLPEYHHVAIGGIHYTLLGPVLLTLGEPLSGPVGAPARRLYLALLGTFTVAVMGQAWATPVGGSLPLLAALAGSGIVLWWAVALSLRLWRSAESPVREPERPARTGLATAVAAGSSSADGSQTL